MIRGPPEAIVIARAEKGEEVVAFAIVQKVAQRIALSAPLASARAIDVVPHGLPVMGPENSPDRRTSPSGGEAASGAAALDAAAGSPEHAGTRSTRVSRHTIALVFTAALVP